MKMHWNCICSKYLKVFESAAGDSNLKNSVFFPNLNRIQHKDVFELIKKHNLYDEIYQKIVPLIQLDSEQAISMLLERNKIPSEVVIEQLQNHEEYLYMVGLSHQ